jgi:putative NADH-flavin reductase
MKLVIFGANGPVGKLLTRQALSDGHEVSAVTRHPDTLSIQHDRFAVLSGDVFNVADVGRAINGHDAVLSLVQFHSVRRFGPRRGEKMITIIPRAEVAAPE